MSIQISQKNLLEDKDGQLRKAWWNRQQNGEHEIMLEIDNSNKLDFLETVYSELYSELREIHSRQQQVVTWGLTLLTGGGFVTLVLSNTLAVEGSIIFSIALAFLTFALTKTLGFLSEDRMSIARQLDRMHQIMGVFKKDYYAKGLTLFDPIWSGWGFERDRDVNWRLSRTYQIVLWAILITDVLLLLNKAHVISFF